METKISETSEGTTITFLLPGVGVRPSGGLKIVYEYANRFVKDGYRVNMVYPAVIGWKRASMLDRAKMIGFGAYCLFTGWKCKKWFKLDERIPELFRFNLSPRNLPKSDIFVATEARTAGYVDAAPADEDKKFYFIQALEDWVMSEEELFETYRLPLKKLVISKWLHNRLAQRNLQSTIVPNGFDFNYFSLNNPIDTRDRFCISMMYSESEYKDSPTSIEALKIVKKKYPALKVLTFGTHPRPDFLPEWFQYFRKPDKQTHNRIYNDSAIYVASAVNEGWGLTVGEAMMCGAAVVCSEIDGYKEMVENGRNGVMFPPRNPEKMAEKIIGMIENDDYRKKIAVQGNEDIRNFDTDKSYLKFKQALGLK